MIINNKLLIPTLLLFYKVMVYCGSLNFTSYLRIKLRFKLIKLRFVSSFIIYAFLKKWDRAILLAL